MEITMTNLKVNDTLSALIPSPQHVESSGLSVCIGEIAHSDFKLECSFTGVLTTEGISLFLKKICEVSAIVSDNADGKYIISMEPDTKTNKPESYNIDISESKTVITASDDAGMFYAMITLSKILFVKGGFVFLPVCKITDYPSFKYRSQFLESRYGNDFRTLDEWKEIIDYLAEIKQNSLTISVYGCWTVQYDGHRAEFLFIPFVEYPELKTYHSIKYYSVKENKWCIKENVLPEMFEKDFLGEIIAYGKKRNVCVKPLFNSLGHNSLIPRIYGELSAKDENGDDKLYGFCTESKKTRSFMTKIYDAIIDKYLLPNGISSIHIGLDEINPSIGVYKNDLYRNVSHLCMCNKCIKKGEREATIDYLVFVLKHLKSRGMKDIYVYNDMFFERFNCLDDNLKGRLIQEGVYDNVVFDWWSYSGREEDAFGGRIDEVNNKFRSIIKPMTGYYHWCLPSENNANIALTSSIARRLNYEGIEAYGDFDFSLDKNFKFCADVSWNEKSAESTDEFNKKYALSVFGCCNENILDALYNMRDVMNYDTKENLPLLYNNYFYTYLAADKPYPRMYPGEVFDEILSNGEEKTDILKEYITKAKKAYEIFSRLPYSKMRDIWKNNAMQYITFCEIFVTLSMLQRKYDADSITSNEILNTVESMIEKQKSLMLSCENIRANAYTLFRNNTVVYQFLVELKENIEKDIRDGIRYELNIRRLGCADSAISRYLR